MVWTGNLGAAAWNPSKPKEKSLKNWCGREIIHTKNRLCAHKHWCGHQIQPLAATASQTVRKWRIWLSVCSRRIAFQAFRAARRHVAQPDILLQQSDKRKRISKENEKRHFPHSINSFQSYGSSWQVPVPKARKLWPCCSVLGASSQSELPLLAWQLLTWS